MIRAVAPAVASVCLLAAGCSMVSPTKSAPAPATAPTAPTGSLSFSVEGRRLPDLAPEALARAAPPEELAVFDREAFYAQRHFAPPGPDDP